MRLAGDWGSCGLDQIASGLEQVRAQDLLSIPGVRQREELVRLHRLSNQLEAEITRRVANFDSSQAYADTLALTTQSWLRGECNLTPNQASERVRVARKLEDLPRTAEAFASGDMSLPHASLITHVAEKVGDKFDSEAEDIFVNAARDLDPWRLRIVARRFRDAVDPDGSLDDANEQYQRRHLHLSQTMDGIFHLNGMFDSEGGAILQTALDALRTPRDSEELRSTSQIEADNLVELARRQLNGGKLPEVAGQKPHVAITAPLAALKKEPGAGGGDLAWAYPVPADTVRRYACDAAIARVLLGPRSEILDLGRETSVVSLALKRALIYRDKGCRFPRCDKPWQWTDGHHIIHWVEGGPTDLDNLVLLCRRHHRCVHEEGWQVHRDAAGDLWFTDPWTVADTNQSQAS